MDFRWFFRNNFRNHDEDDSRNFPKNREELPTFEFPFSQAFENFEDGLFQFNQMEDIINEMFSSSFRTENFHPAIDSEEDPRSLMLKIPECEGCKTPCITEAIEKPLLVDSDIDEQVAKHNVLKIDVEKNRPLNFSFHKFSSFKTLRLPDGTVEEHRTSTDSQGNSVTTLRRSIGGKTYEVITHSDAQGLSEKQENLINLDENDLSDFNEKWKTLKSEKQMPSLSPIQKHPEVPPLTAPLGDPIYLTLFKKFFGV